MESTMPAVIAVRHINCAAGKQLHLFSTRFSVGQFDPHCFAVAALEFPANIQRSVPKRQAEFFYGRLCARHALESIGFADFTVHTGKHREPLWPAGAIGSITHNDEYAIAVAIAHRPGAAIGIDVERVAQGEALAALTSSIISAQEAHYLETLGSSLDYPVAVTLVFSAKESFFKAYYPEVGRYFGFDAVDVTLIDPAEHLISLTVKEMLSPRLVPGTVHQLRYERFNEHTVFTILHR